MNQIKTKQIVSLGLAIFSMFFGAGNLMYPILVGMTAGRYTAFGMVGFLLTAVVLPIIGLATMCLFDGDYEYFFKRIGNRTGAAIIFICMMIIGPVIALPRIATLSHIMIAPFLPFTLLQDTHSIVASFLFSCLFFFITFLAAYRENKIMDILGLIVSPLLLGSLAIIITKALLTAQDAVETTVSPLYAFIHNSIVGYETLDLLGGIFFSSIVLHMLKDAMGVHQTTHRRSLMHVAIKAGLLGALLLTFVYIGMSLIGLFHGHGLVGINAGQLFSAISFKVLGKSGAALIAVSVLMACFSTSIALSAIGAEYIQKKIMRNSISYVTSLIIVLIACLPLSTFGLGHVLAITGGPIVYIGYPVIVAITFCNLAYKVIHFKPIKIPVTIILFIALLGYYAL